MGTSEWVALIEGGLLIAAIITLIWTRKSSQKESNLSVTLDLAADMRNRWESGWAEKLAELEKRERPLTVEDAQEVRYMLNWVNWVGTLIDGGLLPNAELVLSEGSLGNAARRVLTIGQPLIKADIAQFGPVYWQHLRPVCRTLNMPNMRKLLNPIHQHLFQYPASDLPKDAKIDDVVDRLKQFWPEPGDQLHTGGWRSTDWLMHRLAIDAEDSVLDLCCGEGASVIWITRKTEAAVTGIDRLATAVQAASKSARAAQFELRCNFVEGNVGNMPFEDNQFSVVVGQDADGLISGGVDETFAEIARVLKPGGKLGIHHWVPAPNAPVEVLRDFDQLNESLGYPDYIGASADRYLSAMEKAGFRNIQVIDMAEEYRWHMQQIIDMRLAAIAPRDAWTEGWLELAQRHPFGVAIFARK